MKRRYCTCTAGDLVAGALLAAPDRPANHRRQLPTPQPRPKPGAQLTRPIAPDATPPISAAAMTPRN